MPKKRRSGRGQPHTGRAAKEHRRLARIREAEAALSAIDSAAWPEEVRHLPVDPRRNLPIPFVVEQPPRHGVNFGVLDYSRARVCYERRLCAMCGKFMKGDVALYGDVASLAPESCFMEAPVHPRCIEIAIGGLCPYLHSESYPRRRVLDDDVVLAADVDFLHTIGRAVGKRPAVVVYADDYAMAQLITDRGMMPVYLVPKVKLVRFFTWQDGIAAEAPLEEMDDVPMDPM